jgi:hypothetical protein
VRRDPTPSDPCRAVTSINIDDEEDCERLLLRDKHGRLEGLCAEILFEQELVKPAFPKYSTGWWVAKADRQQYKVAHAVETGSQITDLENAVYTHFLARDVPLFRLEYDPRSHTLRRHKLSLSGRKVESRLDGIQAPSPKPPSIPRAPERDGPRSTKALDYLKANRALRSAALSRLIANCYIHSPCAGDIDAIVRHKGKMVAFETKQKFPSRSGYFGINQGLAGMFSFLNSVDIRVIHVVLTKPVWDTTTSAIDLLTLPQYAGKSLWLATDGSNIESASTVSDAPARTSIDGSRRLRTLNLEVTSFHHLAAQGAKQKTSLVDFLDGKTTNVVSLKSIPKTFDLSRAGF